jgi:hypothetical protein
VSLPVRRIRRTPSCFPHLRPCRWDGEEALGRLQRPLNELALPHRIFKYSIMVQEVLCGPQAAVSLEDEQLNL